MIQKTGFFKLAIVLSVWLISGAQLLSEQLIVFTRGKAPSEVNAHFRAETLLPLKKWSRELGMEFVEVDVEKQGAPELIRYTPSIVYQNHLGRSLFQGRYLDRNRILNFIRRSRHYPQKESELPKENILVEKMGRMNLGLPLKISPLSGTSPWFYWESSFLEKARAEVESVFSAAKSSEAFAFARGDRLFYMDIYPWSDGSDLHLSLALFSQYHCKDPVMTRFKDQAIIGPWGERDRLFREAAHVLKKSIQQQLSALDHGDAFEALKGDIQLVSWSKLGLDLPSPPSGSSATVPDSKSLSWGKGPYQVADAHLLSPPRVSFSFPAPLDQYSGELSVVRGQLIPSGSGVFADAKGFIEVDPRSVSMGEEDLDEALMDESFLDVESHPVSRFDFEVLLDDHTPLDRSAPTFGRLKGIFQMKGVKKEMDLPVVFETMVDAKLGLGLQLSTEFQLDLRTFDVEGADGPAPQNHTLNFNVELEFYAKNKKGDRMNLE